MSTHTDATKYINCLLLKPLLLNLVSNNLDTFILGRLIIAVDGKLCIASLVLL